MEAQDRRSEIRLQADTPVTLTVLGGTSSPARVLNLSGTGLLLAVNRPIACGAAVSISGGDALLLGEVCRCKTHSEDWRVAVRIRHSLRGLLELDRLNRRLLGITVDECSRSAPPVPSAS